MKMSLLSLTLLLVFGTGVALAQEAPTAGWRAEYLRELADQENKLITLAESLPADAFEWRPAADVRSYSEVFLHIATANFGIPGRLGATPPEGLDLRGLEKSTTAKDEIIQHLRDSFDHVRTAVIATSDADADQSFPWFGGTENTKRGLLLFMARHTSEHLGQLIAYARMNGHTPPWSEG